MINDYSKGAEHLIKFNIDLEDATKREIEEAVFKQMAKILDGEEFAVINGQRCFHGIRQGDQFFITKAIGRLL
ncbi:hypothetical protein AB4Z22_03395 [Paenibacillus sp. TAF58]